MTEGVGHANVTQPLLGILGFLFLGGYSNDFARLVLNEVCLAITRSCLLSGDEYEQCDVCHGMQKRDVFAASDYEFVKGILYLLPKVVFHICPHFAHNTALHSQIAVAADLFNSYLF